MRIAVMWRALGVLSESLVRTHARRGLLLAGLVFVVMPVGSALAATTVGRTGAPIDAFGSANETALNDATITGRHQGPH
jgi:hypothetical protein